MNIPLFILLFDVWLCQPCSSQERGLAARLAVTEGRGESAGRDLGVPGISRLLFGQEVCVAVQSRALGDRVTLKSFSGLLIHRNSLNSQTGALGSVLYRVKEMRFHVPPQWWCFSVDVFLFIFFFCKA